MDDLRQALRTLRRQPGFSAVAILTLALGIGVNITLFSMFSAFFLQPLPVPDAHRLVVVMQRGEALSMPFGHSYPDYRDYREATQAFSHLAAYMPVPAHLAARGRVPERTWIEVVSPNYFTLADVSPALGTFPQPVDEQKGTAPVVVLSYRYWQRRFGGDPAIVGQPVTINGTPFTVIGIAPERFTGLSWAMAVSAFVPSGATGALIENGDAFRENRSAHAWRLMGRLAATSTIGEAGNEIEVMAARLALDHPAEHRGARVVVMPENRSRPDPSIAGFLPVFAVVFAAMGALVLLIACANVANLLLGRAIERGRDLVVRSALGASRVRLVRLLVVESLVLAAAAGLAGVLLAQWAGEAIAAFTPTGDVPINDQRAADWRAYAFTFFISAAAGVVTGVWPALKATRFNLIESLKDGAGTATASRHGLRNLLVIGQVTMALVVLVSGGLFVQSLRQLGKLDVGFKADGVFMMSLDLGLHQYTDTAGRRFLEDLLMRVDALPGVTSASVASHVPFEHAAAFIDLGTEEAIPGSTDGLLSVAYSAIGPRFFDTMQTPLVRGRGVDGRDVERSPRVAVVNETLARQLWPGQDAVGRRFRLGRQGHWIEVVGIARDGRYITLAERSRPYLYLPLAQLYRSPVTLLVRSTSDPSGLAGPVQRQVNELDATLPVFNARSMTRHMRDSVFALMPVRVGAAIASVQGAIGLFLAVLGLYAVVSYTVTRRTREIGVRMALGAGRMDVFRLVARDSMRLAFIGVAIGLLIAAGIGLLMSRILHGLAPVDLAVVGSATALLVGVAAAAWYASARKATRLDPLTALRTE